MRVVQLILAAAGFGLLMPSAANAQACDGFAACGDNVCLPGTRCDGQECKPCCPPGSLRGIQPCCDCPSVGSGLVCVNGTCESGCNVADSTIGCGATLSVLPGAFGGHRLVARDGATIDWQGLLLGGMTAGAGGTVHFSGTCDPQHPSGSSLSAAGGSATISDGCVGVASASGPVDGPHGSLLVTGGQILHSVGTSGTSRAVVGAVTVGLLPDGTVSPLPVSASAQGESELELNAAEMAREVQLSDMATLKLNDATVHGSVGLTAGNPLSPQRPTVIMNGGTVDGSVGAYTVNITGGNIGGGVSVLGIGATGTIGAATIAGQVTAGGGTGQGGVTAIVVVSGGKIGGTAANGATISVSDAEVTGAATVIGLGLDVGTLTITGGTVESDVSARGLNSPTALNTFAEITGSNITGNVHAHDGSQVTLISGNVAGEAIASGNTSTGGPSNVASVLKIQGGSVGSAKAAERGLLDLSGGTVLGNLSTELVGRLLLSGGTVQGNLVANSAGGVFMSGGEVLGDATSSSLFFNRFNMSGGRIAKDVSLSGGTQITLDDGSIGGNLILRGDSGGNVKGGTITGRVQASDGNHLSISGGEIHDVLTAFGTSTIEMENGQVLVGLGANENSTITVSGGSVTDIAQAADLATLKLSGTALINGELKGVGQGTIELSGGSAQFANIGQSSKVTISGTGTIQSNLSVIDSGHVILIGGKVLGNLPAEDFSTVQMTDGQIGGGIQASDTSQISVDGGTITKFLSATGQSVVDMTGGTVSGDLTALENGTVNLSGGKVIGAAEAFDTATLNLSGGRIEHPDVRPVTAYDGATINVRGSADLQWGVLGNDNSTINVSGGYALHADALDTSSLNVTGGELGGIALFGESVCVMTGGKAELSVATYGNAAFTLRAGQIEGFDVRAQGTSTVAVLGGSIGQDLVANEGSVVDLGGTGSVGNNLVGFNTSRIHMTGGIVNHEVFGFDNCIITISGGTVLGAILARGNATINVSGGIGGQGGAGLLSDGPNPGPQAPALNLTAEDRATVRFIGTDLAATLVDPNFQGLYSLYELTGKLADGTEVSGAQFQVRNDTGATFKLVPFVPADLDRDGDVDADDFAVLEECTTGPALGPVAPGCERADLDADNDVDQSDFGIFQRCWRGEGEPADATCANLPG